jgi:regulator of nonsense transcripts 2
MKYLGELYMYRLISSTLVFDTLWSLVTFGHRKPKLTYLVISDANALLLKADGRPLPGQVSPIDAPDDFFRIRLVCILLDACGMCFDQGSQKKKLDNFLTFLQVGLNSCPTFLAGADCWSASSMCIASYRCPWK